MMNDRIYTEAYLSKSVEAGTWETDKHGNPIIIIEASNENLDYDGERVMRSALMNSKPYFLQNGVISYDHKHIPSPERYKEDPEYNPEKYVIGKPLDAWEATNDKGEQVVKVKAVLSRSNEIAQQIISKLKDGLETVKASVGGRKVRKAIKVDPKNYKDVPTIMGVDWDEVALTYKPVNQTLGATTLCPVDFVKSLTAGSSANPSEMTGGNTLQAQSLEAEPIKQLLEKINCREIKKSNDAINHLTKCGFSDKEAKFILKTIIDKKMIGDVMDGNEINNSTDELLKALDDLDGGSVENEDLLVKAMRKMKDGETMVKKGGHSYIKKADDSYEKVDPDSPDYNGDEDDEDMGKSIDNDVYDATEEVMEMKKSIEKLEADNAELKTMVKSIADTMEKQSTVLKSLGNVAVANDEMLKSISNAPAGRQTGNLKPQPRFEKSIGGSIPKTRAGLLKSLSDAGVDSTTRGAIDIAVRRAGSVEAVLAQPQYAGIVDAITKEV